MAIKTGNKTAAVKAKKKISRQVSTAVAHIHATYNNTIVTITDPSGKVIAWASAGGCGFSGSRKSSAFAATVAAQEAIKRAGAYGVKELDVIIRGPGAGRESAVRGLVSSGAAVSSVSDKTPVAHGGCRQKKRRRC